MIYKKQEEELLASYMGDGATGGYFQSWDWLMPVVLKINSSGYYFFWEEYQIKICRFSDGSGIISKGCFFKSEDALITIYKTVVDFLQKQNESTNLV